jgi:hypothetical protein
MLFSFPFLCHMEWSHLALMENGFKIEIPSVFLLKLFFFLVQPKNDLSIFSTTTGQICTSMYVSKGFFIKKKEKKIVLFSSL